MKKQDMGFPEVAIIRKGKPKKKVMKTYGNEKKEIEVVGEDLGQKFRVQFLPGAENARSAFHAIHAKELVTYPENYLVRQGYELLKLRAVIPATNVWQAWDYGIEAYQAGRRVALADDDHFIMYKNPLNGNEFYVKDGEPYKKFEHGVPIKYERDGKTYELPMKTHGRLRLVLEDMVNSGLLVQVVLKTTSYYDCLNIKNQLAGIQAIADIVNNGNAGGVPFEIYRGEQEVMWNKPDGGAMRVKKWFYNIQADSEWVKRAFARMSTNILTGETIAQALLPSTLAGPVDPELEDDEEDQIEPIVSSDDVVEGKVIEQQQELSISKDSKDNTTYNFLSEKIVNAVAKRTGIPSGEAAKWLGKAQKDGRIQQQLTIEQAVEFASHLNV